MVRMSFLLVCFCFVCPEFCDASTKIHPRNRMLLKQYPRPFKMRYPEVPRVTAQETLVLHKMGKALLIGVGASAKLIVGGFCYKDYRQVPIRLLKKMSKTGKYIIVY